MRFQSQFLFVALVSAFATQPATTYGRAQAAPSTPRPAAPTAAPQPQAQPQAAPIPKTKAAKVWTNDEIDTLHNDPSISVMGSHAPQRVSTKSKSAVPQEKDPAWYRQQLLPLQAEIEKLDVQIAKLQAFLNGQNVSDPPTLHCRMTPTPQDQLKQMEKNRAKDIEKVNDLLDRARHNEIPPGALR